MNIEPLLDPTKRTMNLSQITYKDIWALYHTQVASFWQAAEVDFSQDYQTFQKLSENEKHFIKRVLAFFANADGIVNFNISTRFMSEITNIEAITCYQFQMAIENQHAESYALMLESIVTDTTEKMHLFNAITTIPSIAGIADWANKYVNSDAPFPVRLIAFAVIEGIIFSGAFACIFWLKRFRPGLVPGLIKSNEFIARDEGMHVDFACLLYSKIVNKLSYKTVIDVIDSGVQLAIQFMSDALPCKLLGMSSSEMELYIKYISNILLVKLGYSKYYVYGKSDSGSNPGQPIDICPFPFMETIGMHEKVDFFTARPTQYQTAYSGTTDSNRNNSGLELLDSF
jgi:ribonucleotide reductase beta subunit family protein with ferritin-like domain